MALLFKPQERLKEITEGEKALFTAAALAEYGKDSQGVIDKWAAKAGELDDALAETGIKTEIIQDNLADLAINPGTYATYLKYKRDTLNQVRQEVLRAYASAIQTYMNIGYSKSEAEKLAREVAKDTKASHMKIFKTLFPHSGQKIVPTY